MPRENVFSDEDLEIAKSWVRHGARYMDHGEDNDLDIQALLERLEAAEKVIGESTRSLMKTDLEHDAYRYHHDWHEALEAWRKVSGKENP